MSLPKRAVWLFSTTDPWANLSAEEALWEILPQKAVWLVLYVNRPCIVIGKHQNPLREVKLDVCRRLGAPIVRRVTGGGTVWHDEGNLNFSWMTDKSLYDKAQVSAFLVRALADVGLAVTVGEKGDLLCGGKKISGNASAIRPDRVLHHGTLLCQARLADLRLALGPTGELTDWVGVASRPMSVANLVDGNPQATVDGVRTALVERFLNEGEGVQGDFEALERDGDFARRRDELRRRLTSSEWTWDETPAFSWKGPTKIGEVAVRVEGGVVASIQCDDPGFDASRRIGESFFSRTYFDETQR